MPYYYIRTLTSNGWTLQNFFIIPLVLRDDSARAETVNCRLSSSLRHFLVLAGIRQQGDYPICLGRYVADRFEVPVDAVRHQLRDAADIGRDRGDPTGHSFERREPEAFRFAWHQQDMRLGEQPFHMVLFTQE